MAELIVPDGQPIWPDLTRWVSGKNFSDLKVGEADVEALFGKILEFVDPKSTAADNQPWSRQTAPTHETPTKVTQHDDPVPEGEYRNYTHGEIVAHPTMTLLEAVINILLILVPKPPETQPPAEGAGSKPQVPLPGEKTLEMCSVVVELVALAFSFPNMTDFQLSDTPDDKVSLGKIFEILGFVARTGELFIETIFWLLKYWKKKEPSPKTRWIIRIICTGFEFAFGMTATCIRRSMSTIDDTERTAAGLAIGNACASLAEHVCAIVADDLEGTPKGVFLGFAALFAVCDTGLDAGRGGYEWNTEKKLGTLNENGFSSHNAGTHVVTFETTTGGTSEAVVTGDYSGTHQIVTF